jgi:hypothetical protein
MYKVLACSTTFSQLSLFRTTFSQLRTFMHFIEFGTISDTTSLMKHTDKPTLLQPYEQLYNNYFIITITLFCNNTQMNKILCSNYFTTHIIHHTLSDILINTSTSARPNQFHSTLHTRQSSTQVCLPIHQLYFYCIFCSSFNYQLNIVI